MTVSTRSVDALRAFARSAAPERRTIGRDAVAGIPGAIGSVPDGIASSVLVGVSPIHGLYASFHRADHGRPDREHAADGRDDDDGRGGRGVLRLRGRTSVGATGLAVLAAYGTRIEATRGRLYLSGVDPALVEQLRHSGRLDGSGPVHLVEAGEVIGESTNRAYAEAEAWLSR